MQTIQFLTTARTRPRGKQTKPSFGVRIDGLGFQHLRTLEAGDWSLGLSFCLPAPCRLEHQVPKLRCGVRYEYTHMCLSRARFLQNIVNHRIQHVELMISEQDWSRIMELKIQEEISTVRDECHILPWSLARSIFTFLLIPELEGRNFLSDRNENRGRAGVQAILTILFWSSWP